MAVASSAVAVPVTAPYTQSDFDRENQAFEANMTFQKILQPFFSPAMYLKADRAKVLCAARFDHRTEVVREVCIWNTNVIIALLNRTLLDPEHSVERDAQYVMQKVADFFPIQLDEANEKTRVELRHRVINVFFEFYSKQLISLAKFLIKSGQASTVKEAAQLLTKNESCGSFVDALACQVFRLQKVQCHQLLPKK